VANWPYYDDDPGDKEFFEGQNVEEPMRWFRGKDSYTLDASQMRALGRVVVGAMTEHAEGDVSEGVAKTPERYLDDQSLATITGEISSKMTSILRRPITTYSSHYSTRSERTGLGRDNVAFVFVPTLVFNGTQVNFVFDRISKGDEEVGV
jgi:hypothetical protein